MFNIEVVAEKQSDSSSTQKLALNALKKAELRAIADRLKEHDADAIAAAVAFVEHESVAHWHGRARVVMCRRLRHEALSAEQSARVVAAVLKRLREGTIYEGFRDQLRAALMLDQQATLAAARAALHDQREYVRRHAAWVLSRP